MRVKEGTSCFSEDGGFLRPFGKASADEPAFAKAWANESTFAKASAGKVADLSAVARISKPAFAKAPAGGGGD